NQPMGSFTLTVQFSEPLNASLLSWEDFSLISALDYENGLYRTADSFAYDAATSTFTINYSGLPDDFYTLELFSRSIDLELDDSEGLWSFEDLVGWNLDGEAIASPMPPNVSGDGVEGGDFVLKFALDLGSVEYPTRFQSMAPWASLIVEGPSYTAA